MTDQNDALRSSIVAAVQLELARYNEMVSAELQRLRDEVADERTARARTDEQVLALLPAVERAQATSSAFQTEIQRALEARLTEFSTVSKRRQEDVEARIGRIADATNLGLVAAVEAAAQPIVKQLEYRQAHLETELGSLDRTVRKFDDQAAKIVEHINVVTEATEGRIDEVSALVAEEIDGRLAGLVTRLDEVSAQAARQQAEVANVVGSRVDQAEARINERLLTTEARINETTGQRIADIDAYVGRVSVSLDEAVNMLSDRIAGTDARFGEVNTHLDAVAARLDAVDVDALDDLKDRVAGLAGEVELIRIETERFQESMGQTMDKAVVRIVEVETQLQEQQLDVETAVQLERLEEVERALIALNPDQFVRRSDAAATSSHINGASLTSTSFAPPATFSAPVDAQH
ncbi:MAG TPA: hypothetical protein VES40_07915 [Ilumatobacteraceae bacterium]|nr:hypothetical protein [Ilumatobacteraceae bacterium]